MNIINYKILIEGDMFVFNKTIFIVIKINKKMLIIIIALLILLLLVPIFILKPSVSVFNSSRKTITIDPGHGGIDGGSSSAGILEKNINLQVSLKLNNILKNKGINVVMTRNKDISLESKSNIKASRYRRDLNARKKIIDNNKSAAFVSLHVDAHKQPSARGVRIFYYPTSEKSKNLAKNICNKINKIVFDDFLNTKDAKAIIQTGNYYLLRESKSPGVIVEIGFITNPIDNKLIQNQDYQYKMTKAIAEGLLEYIIAE